MSLSDDQRALLRLLAQRDEGYEDIGALLGLSVDGVRARVREALAALDDEVEARIPPERAEPLERAQPPQGGASGPPPAEATAANLLYESPKPPAKREPAQSKPPPRSAEAQGSGWRRLSPPRDRRRLFELLGGAVVVLLIVLFATGTVNIGGGSGSSKTTTAAGPEAAATIEGKRLTQAVLKPVNGGNAIGRALFGRVGSKVVLQVVAKGLAPSPVGESYTVWLFHSPKVVLRVGAVKVPPAGGLAARFPLPTQLLAYVASGAFDQIVVSLTSDTAYKAELARAKAEKRLPAYAGKTVLRGAITGPAVKK